MDLEAIPPLHPAQLVLLQEQAQLGVTMLDGSLQEAKELLVGRRALHTLSFDGEQVEVEAQIYSVSCGSTGLELRCQICDNPHRIVGLADISLADLRLASTELISEEDHEAQTAFFDEVLPEPTDEERAERIAKRIHKLLNLARRKGLLELVHSNLVSQVEPELLGAVQGT
jgi:hypothetical protein